MSADDSILEGLAGLRVGVFGATGLIGSALVEQLSEAGARVVGFSRRTEGRAGEWRSSEGSLELGGLDAVVNLAGESVAQRWSAGVRERIRSSRSGLSRRIVEGLAALETGERPRVFLSGSAVGYYGSQGDTELTEAAGPGDGFLAEVCREWEDEAAKAEECGVRVVFIRTGVVLGRESEAWTKMARVFRLGLGGRLGSGRQWMPWVHLDDEVRALLFLLNHDEVRGPVNVVAPSPLRNADFTRELAAALRRPAILPVPGWALRLGLGGFAGQLLASQRVVPAVLQEAGFAFRYPTFGAALGELCG